MRKQEITAGTIVIIVLTVCGCVSQPTLPAMELTLVGLDGTEKILTEADIGDLPSYEGKGGLMTSAGTIVGPDTYKGVLLTELADLVGGLSEGTMVQITASDGYSMILTYDQVTGHLVTFDATGAEVEATEPLKVMLAYYQNGDPLDPEQDGVLRVAIVGEDELITEGQYWIKFVVKVEIRQAIPAMELTLVGLDGTEKVLTETQIAKMPAYEDQGGLMTSAGSIFGPNTYKGVLLMDLCERVGGLNESTAVRVTAADGYSMLITYDQVMGNLVTFDAATGDEVEATKPLKMMLAYFQNGEPLDPEQDGTLRLVVVGEEGLITEGHYWIKFVVKVEIRPIIREYELTLTGAMTEVMNRGTYESGVNCHGESWTDSDGQEWTGIPLWLLVGRVDDSNQHEGQAFNRALADAGYTIQVIAGDGYTLDLNSSFVNQNPNIILANELDGAPLPEKYWPLRLVGADLSKSDMIRNVVEIKIIFES